MDVRLAETSALTPDELNAIRRLLDEAFAADFSEDDWQHALGGWHALIIEGRSPVAHAAVVGRRLFVGDRACRTGYVEAVAVLPRLQGTGLGTAVMAAATDLVLRNYDLGALSTGEWGFYARLGWERWRGPTNVRTADGRLRRSPEEDDAVMVLRCPPTRDIDLTAAIACEERSGDSW
jgi:aminoglycoside 2'-N-acetyltransferase I